MRWMTLLLLLPALARAYGPYGATVERVVDGDTLVLSVELWPGLTKQISLRVDGVNTPEKRPRQPEGMTAEEWAPLKACEKGAAQEASAFVEQLLPVGSRVIVNQVHLGKFAGRALGSVLIRGQGDLGELLIERGHAESYDGGQRGPWCLSPSGGRSPTAWRIP